MTDDKACGGGREALVIDRKGDLYDAISARSGEVYRFDPWEPVAAAEGSARDGEGAGV